MGHEFCGVVTNAGDSKKFKIGDCVTFWANLYCGKCDMCMEGKEHLCREVNGTNYIGFVCNGAYAEKFVGKEFNCYHLPDTVSDIDAGCIDPLMVAYHAMHRSGIKLHDKVLVIGTGIIGHFIGDLVRKCGASFVAMSKINDLKLHKAKELNLFDAYLDGNEPKFSEKAKEISKGGFDISFEVVGTGITLDQCVDSVRPGGKVVVIGNSIEPKVPFCMNRAALQEITIIGSVSCTRVEFEETIDLIASGMIKPEKYVKDILSLDDLQKAMERQIVPNDPLIKSVIKFN